MSRHSFHLTAASRHKKVVVPIPQDNHYQIITQLTYQTHPKDIAVTEDATMALFESEDRLSVNFVHQPLEIKKDLFSCTFKRAAAHSLVSDNVINGNAPPIQALAQQWLSESQPKNLNEIIAVFYEKHLEYLTYGKPIPGLYTWQEALESTVTDCGGFSTLLGSLLQSQGLYSRLVVGHLYRRDWKSKIKRTFAQTLTWSDISMHAWLEVQQADGLWFPLDGSVDWKRRSGLSTRAGGLGHTPSDRLVLSFGHNHEFRIDQKTYHFPLFQHVEELKRNL